MITDSIADMLTIIRNGYLAGVKSVKIPASKMKTALAEVLKREEYVSNFKVEERWITVTLRYVSMPNSLAKVPAMSGIDRISKPSLRKYSGSQELPRVMGGLGTYILTTSKGLMTSQEARKQKLGGEVICKIW